MAAPVYTAPVMAAPVYAPQPTYAAPAVQSGCACQSSCRSTGCGGCCGSQQASNFSWASVAQKSCCGVGACTTGCAPAPVAVAPARTNRYCHVHEEDKNRTRKVQEMVDSTI